MIQGAIIGAVIGVIVVLIQNKNKKAKQNSDILDHTTNDENEK